MDAAVLYSLSSLLLFAVLQLWMLDVMVVIVDVVVGPFSLSMNSPQYASVESETLFGIVRESFWKSNEKQVSKDQITQTFGMEYLSGEEVSIASSWRWRDLIDEDWMVAL